MRQNKGATTLPAREAEACTASLTGSTHPRACTLMKLRPMIDHVNSAIPTLGMIPAGCCHEEQTGDIGFMEGEEGASMAEYAILLAVITGALVTILAAYTQAIGDIFNYISSVLTAVTAGGS